MKKIIFAIATVCLALTAVSCERNLTTFTYDGKQCPYFSGESINLEISAEDGGKVMVPVSRINTKGGADIPFTFIDNSDGMFSCNQSTVSFKDGEDEAYITVSHVDVSEYAPFATYNFNLTLQGNEYIEVAGTGAQSSTVKIKKKVVITKADEPLGKTTVNSQFVGKTLSKDLYCANEEATYYFVDNIYGSGYDLEFYINPETKEVIVTSNEKPLFYYEGYGDVYIYDAVGVLSEDGKTVTISSEYYLDAIGYSFGICNDVITLP